MGGAEVATESVKLAAEYARRAEQFLVLPCAALSWENRERHLKTILRWDDWDVMFYRTNLFIHSKRMKALGEHAEILAPFIKHCRDFDVQKFWALNEYHDDYERDPVLGDVTLRKKYRMSPAEKAELERKEILAAGNIAGIYAVNGRGRKIDGYPIHDLFMHAIRKDCIEARANSVVDKLVEGFCEGLHEVLAGNAGFAESVFNYPQMSLTRILDEYLDVREIFFDKESIFSLEPCDLHEYFDGGRKVAKPHTLETIGRPTGLRVYDLWKEVTVRLFGYKQLIHQREFCPQD